MPPYLPQGASDEEIARFYEGSDYLSSTGRSPSSEPDNRARASPQLPQEHREYSSSVDLDDPSLFDRIEDDEQAPMGAVNKADKGKQLARDYYEQSEHEDDERMEHDKDKDYQSDEGVAAIDDPSNLDFRHPDMEKQLASYGVGRTIPNTRADILKHSEATTLQKRDAFLLHNANILLPLLPPKNYITNIGKDASGSKKADRNKKDHGKNGGELSSAGHALPEFVQMMSVQVSDRVSRDLTEHQKHAFLRLLWLHDNGANGILRYDNDLIVAKMISVLASALQEGGRKAPPDHHRPILIVAPRGKVQQWAKDVKDWEGAFVLDVAEIKGTTPKVRIKEKADAKTADVVVVDLATFRTEFKWLDNVMSWRYLIYDEAEDGPCNEIDPALWSNFMAFKAEYRMVVTRELTTYMWPEFSFLYPNVFKDDFADFYGSQGYETKYKELLQLLTVQVEFENLPKAVRRGSERPDFSPYKDKFYPKANPIKHQSFCQGCLEFTEKGKDIFCTKCPRSYHADSYCLPKSQLKSSRKNFVCRQHACTDDTEMSSACGRTKCFLYVCRKCSKAFCEEHFNFHVKDGGVVGYELEEFNMLQFPPRENTCYVICETCANWKTIAPHRVLRWEELMEDSLGIRKASRKYRGRPEDCKQQ